MGKRRRGYSDWTIRLWLWGTVLFVAMIIYFNRHPMRIESDEKIEPGAAMVLDNTSDILLVVDYDALPKNPKSFDEVDFSLAWYNTLQQEVGPISLCHSEDFSEEELSKYHFVILTRSASGHSTWIPKLKGFVNSGNILVLELPQGDIRSTFSADGKSGFREPQQITRIAGLSEEHWKIFKNLNLKTRQIGSTNYAEFETLLVIDAIPAIYRRRFGKGWAITVDFDYGMLLTAIQQGDPGDDFRIRNHHGSDRIETIDLVRDEPMLEVLRPLADGIERVMVYGILGSSYPVVTFWPYYKGMDGAFIATHEEGRLGNASLWIAQHEQSFQGRSTYFIDPTSEISSEDLMQLREWGIDIGLDWSKGTSFRDGAYHYHGFWGIYPIAKSLSLIEQVHALMEKQEDPMPLISVRTRGHLWDRDWVGLFKVIAAAGFRADVSFAPLPGHVAYAFGTGLPFMPLDERGLGFANLFEFPLILVAEGKEEERTLLEKVMDLSQKSDHEAIGVSFSPKAFVLHPTANLYLTWRDMYQMAMDKNHWITSVATFLRLNFARQSSTIKTEVIETKIKGKDVTLLRIATMAIEDGIYCTLPSSIGERHFVEARRGITRRRRDESHRRGLSEALLKEPVQTREIHLMGYSRRLLPLQEGFNAIDAIYE